MKLGPLFAALALAATVQAASQIPPLAFNVQDYGVLPDNTDHTEQMKALLAVWYGAGGGEVYFPPAPAGNRYRFTSPIKIPNNGATLPSQPPLRLTGAAASPQSAEVASESVYGGSTLEFLVNTGTACIDTRGKGYLELDHLNLVNGGDDTYTVPFYQTTNTITYAHDNYALGSMSVSGLVCNQTVFVCGGTSTTEDGSANAAFQGYGSVFERNHFNRIRTGMHLRTYANGIVIRDNKWWNECGSPSSSYAAIMYEGNPYPNVGGLVSGNLIEMYAYQVGIKLERTWYVTFSGNNFYDPSIANTQWYMTFDANSYYNIVYNGVAGVENPGLVTQVPTGGDYKDDGAAGNSFIKQTGAILRGDVDVAPVGKGVILKSPDGTRWRLTPSNAGASVWTSL